MSDTYNNVPMSDAMAARTEKEDAFWTGPRLIVLSFVTLAVAFTLLWLMAEGIIGPTQHDATTAMRSTCSSLAAVRWTESASSQARCWNR